MNSFTHRRILAFVIDVLIVAIISSLVTMAIPETKEYKNALKGYKETTTKYANKEIDEKTFTNDFKSYSYIMNKESVSVSIVSLIMIIVYFVVICYFMNGQTIGKRILRLKIISNNGNKLTMNNFLLRSLIINSILLNLIELFSILFLKKDMYFKVNDIMSYVFGGIYIVCIGLITFRKDKRGLHDYLANTKVVYLNGKVKEEDMEKEFEKNKDSKIKDAQIIEKKV